MNKVALIIFPGSNCERETRLAIERAGMEAIEFLWNNSPDQLNQFDGFVLIGGFSYEDRSRAGIIASHQPIIKALKHQSELNKPILGICNGAQILVESGLVPGASNYPVAMALTDNKREWQGKLMGAGYYNHWVHVRRTSGAMDNALTQALPHHQPIYLSAAHAQGQFVMSDAIYQQVRALGLIQLQYCDEQGTIKEEYPINPNGSIANCAAMGNVQGNVLAIMPHPERTHLGDGFFHSMNQAIAQLKNNRNGSPAPTFRGLSAESSDDAQGPHGQTAGRRLDERSATNNPHTPSMDIPVPPIQWRDPLKGASLITQSLITDNTAMTVQKTLESLGFAVKLHRYDYWHIDTEDQSIIPSIIQSEVLFSARKARLVEPKKDAKTSFILTLSIQDIHGLEATQTLKDYYKIPHLNQLQFGQLWQIELLDSSTEERLEQLLNTHIFGNPYAHQYVRFKP